MNSLNIMYIIYDIPLNNNYTTNIYRKILLLNTTENIVSLFVGCNFTFTYSTKQSFSYYFFSLLQYIVVK